MGVMIFIYIYGLQPGTHLSLRPSPGMGTGINGGIKTGQEKQRLSHTGRQETSQKKRRMIMMMMITASPTTLFSYMYVCLCLLFCVFTVMMVCKITHNFSTPSNNNLTCLGLNVICYFDFFSVPTLRRAASI